MSRSRQKSYVDRRRSYLEFQVGEGLNYVERPVAVLEQKMKSYEKNHVLGRIWNLPPPRVSACAARSEAKGARASARAVRSEAKGARASARAARSEAKGAV
ncbi:hypothetical protein OSB04_012898 [Centaurea solstitialis]|uniref:Uncharacterized protein n=1 Tax=Centaurea solstitialis TaxID=347529 RepID=A0AA38TC80_9ASTR|nr:hypothetical protein OSB04_012898 [Centaurea solstitialis]